MPGCHRKVKLSKDYCLELLVVGFYTGTRDKKYGNCLGGARTRDLKLNRLAL